MGASVTENDHSDTNGSVFTRGQKYLSSILARMTVEWKVLIGSFDYPTLLTLRQRPDPPHLPHQNACSQVRGGDATRRRKLRRFSRTHTATCPGALEPCEKCKNTCARGSPPLPGLGLWPRRSLAYTANHKTTRTLAACAPVPVSALDASFVVSLLRDSTRSKQERKA